MMTATINGIEYLPVTDVAAQLATTPLKILMLLKEKALAGEVLNGEWYVSTASLACYAPDLDQHKKRGCRTSCTSTSCGCR